MVDPTGLDDESELERFRTIIEAADLGLAHLSTAGQVLWTNAAFAAILGYSRDEILNKSIRELTHPDDLQASADRIGELFKREKNFSVADRRYRCKNGEYVWVNITGTAVKERNGVAAHILGIIQDVSERKRKEIALQLSEERLKTVLASIQDVVWSFSADEHKLIFINDAAEVIYQRSAIEFYSDPGLWMQVVHPDDQHIVKGITERALSEGTSEDAYRILRPNGQVRWVQARIWYSEGGVVAARRFEGVVRDITEHKENELIIERQRAAMTAAAKMSALGEMAGAIAHEINNPLAIINGRAAQLLQLLESNTSDFSALTLVAQKIETTTLRISKIVKSLRIFARDGDKDPFEKASIKGIIDETSEFCRERFKSHDIHFEVQEIDSNLKLQCRVVQISQVILNLLNNAHDAVEELAEKWIKVSASDLGDSVEVRVSDSGHGIAKEVQEKLFQPFFTTKPLGTGTGLGLSVSQSIVEAHHGTLCLDQNSENTTFVIRLPKGV